MNKLLVDLTPRGGRILIHTQKPKHVGVIPQDSVVCNCLREDFTGEELKIRTRYSYRIRNAGGFEADGNCYRTPDGAVHRLMSEAELTRWGEYWAG